LNSGYVYRTKFGRCEKGCPPLWICDGGEVYALDLYLIDYEKLLLFSWVTSVYDLQVEKMIETTFSANMRAMMQVTF